MGLTTTCTGAAEAQFSYFLAMPLGGPVMSSVGRLTQAESIMRSLSKFFLLTYIVSWFLWIAAAAILHWDISQPSGLVVISDPLYLLGVFAPALVALALTARAGGRTATLALLRRTVKWPVGARWYLFAAGYMATIKLAVALLLRIAAGAWPAFGQEPMYIMVIAIVFSTPMQAGEEIGWRGYLLPRLSARVGLPIASIIVGIVWACWHLPFFFISGADKSGQSFPVYLLSTTALSIAMAWVYWRTYGSLLVTMLMHAAVNNTKDIVPSAVSAATNAFSLRSSLVAWVTVAILWVCAIYFLVQMRGATLPGGGQALSDAGEIASAEPCPPPTNDMHRSRRSAVHVISRRAVRRPGDVRR